MFMPTSVGNGRIWLSGVQGNLFTGSQLEIMWKVNDHPWVSEGELKENSSWGFYVTGDSPSPWGTVDVLDIEQPLGPGSYFSTEMEDRPKYVTFNGEYGLEVSTLVDLTDESNVWYYDSSEHILYFNTAGNTDPVNVQALIDPIFEQGITYRLQVKVRDELAVETVLIDHTFIWAYAVRDYVTRYLDYLMPSYAKSSPGMRKIYIVLAKQAADKYVWFDDVVAQWFLDFTTWGIDFWEYELGILTIPSLTLEQRRALLKARRLTDSSREAFYAAILEVAPNATFSQDFDTYRLDIRLSGTPDPALRRALEKIIQEKKPVGIRVVVSYGQFISGLSLAGDSL